MGNDPIKRKRQSAKSALVTTSALTGNVPAAGRVVRKTDNQPPIMSMQDVSKYRRDAFANIDSSERAAGTAVQQMAAAIIGEHWFWVHDTTKPNPAELAKVMSSKEARADLLGKFVAAFIDADKMPTNPANRAKDDDTRAKLQVEFNRHKMVITRGLELASVLAIIRVGIDAFDGKMWKIPFQELCPTDAREHIPERLLDRPTVLDGTGFGFSYTTYDSSNKPATKPVKFTASVSSLVTPHRVTNGRATRTTSGTTTTQTSTSTTAPALPNLDKEKPETIVDKFNLHPKQALLCAYIGIFSEGDGKSAPLPLPHDTFNAKERDMMQRLAMYLANAMNAADNTTKPVNAKAA